MPSTHPYRGLPDHQFWSRAVTWAAPGGIDLTVSPRFSVSGTDRVATMGSCFAQHLSRHLSQSGLNYYVAEVAPSELSTAEAQRRQYGTFSARYGNVYTVAQAVQLFRRAYGDFVPAEQPWARAYGWVDPFRPLVEPDGFASAEELARSRDVHLAAVRDVFEQADVLVFTLGLTEAWRSRVDGSVFGTAPGASGGEYDPAHYEFVNYDVDDVRRDLTTFCDLLRSVNDSVRVLLTVSPVPLIATFENRHVLVSTTYSKSVLRVAAEDALKKFDFVDYFPSYEMISTASSPRNYYGPDLREVEDLGVSHVMRSFARHYIDELAWESPAAGSRSQVAAGREPAVVCDEETVMAAIMAS